MKKIIEITAKELANISGGLDGLCECHCKSDTGHEKNIGEMINKAACTNACGLLDDSFLTANVYTTPTGQIEIIQTPIKITYTSNKCYLLAEQDKLIMF